MKVSKFIPIALCNFLAIVIFLFAKSAYCQEINISPYFGANVHINEVLKQVENSKIELSEKPIAPGDDLAKINVAYKRTAILKNDIELKVGILKLKPMNAGAIGYWAGNFNETSNRSNFLSISNEIWCFFGENNIKKNHSVCFGVNTQGAYIIMGQYRPDFVHNYSVVNPREYFEMPVFEETPVASFKEIKAIYNFKKWTKKGVKINVSVGNCPLGDYEIPFTSTGIVEIPVLEGSLLIKQTEDLKGAIATLK